MTSYTHTLPRASSETFKINDRAVTVKYSVLIIDELGFTAEVESEDDALKLCYAHRYSGYVKIYLGAEGKQLVRIEKKVRY